MPRLLTLLSIILIFLFPLAAHAGAPGGIPAQQKTPPVAGTLLYTAPDGDLYWLNGTDARPQPLTTDAGEGRMNRSPQVSPDGAWLAYLQIDAAGPGITGTLLISSLATFQPEPIAEAVRQFAWAPEAAGLAPQLAYVDDKDELYRFDPAKSKPQLLTETVLEFAWLPGGKQIAFTITDIKACTPLDNPRGGGVWIYDLDGFLGYELFNLEPTGSRLVHLGVSPDGRWLSVCNGGCATDCIPMLWDQTNKESRPATVLGWSPDGRYYLTAALSTYEISPAPLLAVDTQTDQQIALYEEENHAPLAAEWSPDGKWVAVQSAEIVAGSSYGQPVVLVVSADGLARHAMEEQNLGIAGWSPDSRALLLYSVPSPEESQAAPVSAQRYDLEGAPLGPAFELAYPVSMAWSTAGLARDLPQVILPETPTPRPSPTAASTPTPPPAAANLEPTGTLTATPGVTTQSGADPTGGRPILQTISLRSSFLIYGCALGGILLVGLLGVTLLRRRRAHSKAPDFAPLPERQPPEELPDEAYPTATWSNEAQRATQPVAPPAASPERSRPGSLLYTAPAATPPPDQPASGAAPATPPAHTPPPAAAPGPDQIRAWLEEGMAQARARQYPAAFQSLRRVVQVDPQNGPAWMGLGFVFMQQNDQANAGQCFRRAQALGHPDASRALAQLAGQNK